MKKLLLLATSTIICALFLSCKPTPKGGVVENTYWTLTTIKQGQKTLTSGQQAAFDLVFSKDKLTGNAPCNSYFASYSTDGTALTVSDVGATERMCDEIDLENAYLALLGKAQSYSVLKDRLEIYCENGQLTFAPMPAERVETIKYENGIGQLLAMFPVMEGGAQPHLYPIIRVDNPGNYPFEGTLVDTTLYRYFDSETAGIWSSTGGEVMAVGQYGGLFICRIPGRYVSSDIALFQNANGKLTRTETVAWAWCDEGWCNQQDAWLQDVNQDSLIDIIQHYTLTDDKGKIREERMTVLIQTESGSFKEDTTLKADKSKFPMARI
jgi:heat shock protein HslJ